MLRRRRRRWRCLRYKYSGDIGDLRKALGVVGGKFDCFPGIDKAGDTGVPVCEQYANPAEEDTGAGGEWKVYHVGGDVARSMRKK